MWGKGGVALSGKWRWLSDGMQVCSRGNPSGPVRNWSCTKINCVIQFYLFLNLLFSCLLWKDETYMETVDHYMGAGDPNVPLGIADPAITYAITEMERPNLPGVRASVVYSM